MIDQEDPRLDPMIRKYGCYLMSILYVTGRLKDMTPAQINHFRNDLLINGVKDITKDCTVESPEQVFAFLGFAVDQVLHNGSVEVPVGEAVVHGFEILCYKWPAKGYMHFCAGDGAGNLAYDPIHRGANTVKYGYLHSKRLFEIL